MGRSHCNAVALEDLLQHDAVRRQCTLQQRHGLALREPIGLKGYRPFQFGLGNTRIQGF
jgi:hypothetical protein